MKRANDIEEEAAKWLVQLDSQGSPERWAALDAWLSSNPRHRAAFLRLSVAWTRSDNLRRMRPLEGTVDPDLLSAHSRRSREWSSWLRPRWALAAAAAALAVVALGVTLWTRSEARDAEIYATQIAKPAEEFILQDGSTVVLDTDSEVRVRFTPGHREVKLLRGQALFKVTHSTERPFDVVAGGATVRAVGTEFSVRISGAASKVDVLVTEGRVALNAPWSTTLAAGQAASLNGASVETRDVQGDEITRSLAWVEGNLSFSGATLNEVVSEFNRYNRRRIVIPDPALGRKRVSGTFSAFDPQSFIDATGPGLGVHGRVTDSFFGPRVIRLEATGATNRSD
jgi:transmembrane sensor